MPRKKTDRIGEQTFKDSLFTRFWQSGCVSEWKGALPWTYIYVQAPRDVAIELVRKAFKVEPEELVCLEHQSTRFQIDEDVDLYANAKFYLTLHAGTSTAFVISHDQVPYYLYGWWPVTKWSPEYD